MAKDPAFNFYTNDFDQKTKFFTHEQVGMYLRLLMAQHQHGHLTEAQMLYICGRYDKDVFSKFSPDVDGKFFNDRLELEINKKKAYSESRKKNRNSKNNNTSKTHESTYVNHKIAHMENENENDIENDIKEERVQGEKPVPREAKFEETWKRAFDEITLESYRMKYGLLDIMGELEHFRLKCSSDPRSYASRDPAGLRMAFLHQLKFAKPNTEKKNPKILHDLS